MLLKAWVIVGGGEQNRPAFKDNSCLVVLWYGLSDSMGVAGFLWGWVGRSYFLSNAPIPMVPFREHKGGILVTTLLWNMCVSA